MLYLEFFEHGVSADIISLFSGGGGKDDTYKRVIVTLLDLWGWQMPPARYGPDYSPTFPFSFIPPIPLQIISASVPLPCPFFSMLCFTGWFNQTTFEEASAKMAKCM